MCPGRREGMGMMGAWCIDCVCVQVGGMGMMGAWCTDCVYVSR